MHNLIRILGDRHAGFILCLIVIINLIAGSLVMHHYPELYPTFFHLDLNYFFEPIRKEHIWLYFLLVTFSLFGINLLASTLETTIRLVNTKTGRLKICVAWVFHVALLITMAAHLFEGFYAKTDKTFITQAGVSLPDLGEVKVKSLKNFYHPDGSLKDTAVELSFVLKNGEAVTKKIAYNEPAIFEGGRRQVVLLTAQSMPDGVIISRMTDNHTVHLQPNQPVSLETGRLTLQDLLQARDGSLYARLFWESNEGASQQFYMALSEQPSAHSQFNLDNVMYQFKNMAESPAIVAIIRYNPAIPLMMVSLILAFIATVLLMIWLKNRSKNQVA